jgi:serine-type D-Ala-D-Ala carboxypeptidase (penicillin-binding protein 5/6)
MSSTTRRHPPQVYWRRRLVFVVIPALVIVAIGWAFTDRGFGGRAASERPATSTGATTTGTTATGAQSAAPNSGAQNSGAQNSGAQPSGGAIPKVDVTAPGGRLAGLTAPVWPVRGQAALSIDGRGSLGTSGTQRPAPIASLAKVMTAYVVLRQHPDLTRGLTLVVDSALVRDTNRRRRLDESVVLVRAGERLSESQALEAVLLPSANNIAVALGKRQAGSVAAFVRQMNATAAALGMSDTHYTDPSGFANDTVSTASDQVTLLSAAMRIPAFVRLAGLGQATIPVAGRIRNTDRLIGQDGFILGKTGSDTAAGGCLAFARRTPSRTGTVIMIGAVLGQRGGPLVVAGQRAAKLLVDSVHPSAN